MCVRLCKKFLFNIGLVNLCTGFRFVSISCTRLSNNGTHVEKLCSRLQIFSTYTVDPTLATVRCCHEPKDSKEGKCHPLTQVDLQQPAGQLLSSLRGSVRLLQHTVFFQTSRVCLYGLQKGIMGFYFELTFSQGGNETGVTQFVAPVPISSVDVAFGSLPQSYWIRLMK